MSEETQDKRDWPVIPLLVLAALLIVGLAVFGVLRGQKQPKLTDRTDGTGFPLTAEQRAVTFRAADLKFEVFPQREAIKGLATLTFDVRSPIRKLQLDLDSNYRISAITLNGRPLDQGAWSNPEGMLTVNLPAEARAGETLKLAIAYGGKPHVAARAPWDGGFVWSRTPQGDPWVATAVQGEGCDLFWPCIDHSLVEVGTVDMHVTVPKGLFAAANGRLVGTTSGEDGRPTYHWRARNPNNYAIALNIAPYKELKAPYRSRYGNTIPMHYWYLPGDEKHAAALFGEFPWNLRFYEDMIGPYPFGDEKLAAVNTPHLGMEHQTINAYGNAYKPSAEGFDWLFNHELAHEWFGNQLTNRDWDDMWLHEGFGAYMQPLYARWRDGEAAYLTAMFKQRQTIRNKFPIISGKPKLEHEVYDDKIGPGGDIYVKGSWVLHTLRGLIGDEPFFRATRRLVYGRPDPAPGNFAPRYGTTDEFQRIVSEEAGRDMRWFFDVYLRSAKLPRLDSKRVGNRLDLQWMTPRGLPFPMPVELLVDGQPQTVAMTGGRGTVTLPSASAHVVIDPNARILRQSDSMDRFRDWTAAQAAKKTS